MELRSESFCIFLMISYFIDVGETSSNEESGESVGGVKHRWTLDEEAKLILFDVSTDTGKPGHHERIREEWRREYPGSNVTDNALRNKISKIRSESREEGEYKKLFRWNPELDEELVNVYHTTQPYKEDANMSLEEEWRRRHPDYQATGRYLMWRVMRQLRKYKYLRHTVPGSKKEFRNYWNEDERAALQRIDELTDTGEPKHFDRIKLQWYEKFPKSDKTDKALLHMLHRLRRASKKEEEHKKYFNWTPKEDKILLDTYLNTYPYKKDVDRTFREVLEQRQKISSGREKYLRERARKLMKDKEYSEYSARGINIGSSGTPLLIEDTKRMRKSQWSEDEKAMLLHVHKLTDTGEPKHSDRMILQWRKELPGSSKTDGALLFMLHKLRRESRKEGERKKFLKWTPEEDKMLLDTYLNTYPYRKNVNITFGEVWKQRQEGPLGLERYLLERARKLLRENKYPEYSERGLQAGSSRSRSRKRNEFSPEIRSLEKLLKGPGEAEPERRSGKAPMVYSSDETGPSSPAMISEDSE